MPGMSANGPHKRSRPTRFSSWAWEASAACVAQEKWEGAGFGVPTGERGGVNPTWSLLARSLPARDNDQFFDVVVPAALVGAGLAILAICIFK